MPSKTRSRTRPLTAEETELWSFVTREAKALRRERSIDASETGCEGATAPTPTPPVSKPPPSPNNQSQSKPSRQANANGAAPSLARFDERQRRRLAREPHLIEARLDLHGMRQREAHRALRAFIARCAAQGHRHVLVITGKGARSEIERKRDHFLEEPGVLRRLVPHWLSEPELGGAALSYTAASPRHGGEGALYVRLRKTRG